MAYIPDDSSFFLVCAQESDVATLEKDSLRPRGWEAKEFARSDGTIADPIEVTLWPIGPTEEEEDDDDDDDDDEEEEEEEEEGGAGAGAGAGLLLLLIIIISSVKTKERRKKK